MALLVAHDGRRRVTAPLSPGLASPFKQLGLHDVCCEPGAASHDSQQHDRSQALKSSHTSILDLTHTPYADPKADASVELVCPPLR